jgi:hypothetical protein
VNSKLCIRLGVIAGGFVGLILGLMHGFVCCSPPKPPTWAQLALDGMLAALVIMLLTVWFVHVVTHIPTKPLLLLAVIIGLFCGLILGPLAYHLPHPSLAIIACAVLGAVLGWLVCRILCGKARIFALEVTR